MFYKLLKASKVNQANKIIEGSASKGISYLKEVQANCDPKVPKNFSKWSYVQILFCQFE